MVASQTSLSAHRGSSADIEPRLAELQRSDSASSPAKDGDEDHKIEDGPYDGQAGIVNDNDDENDDDTNSGSDTSSGDEAERLADDVWGNGDEAEDGVLDGTRRQQASPSIEEQSHSSFVVNCWPARTFDKSGLAEEHFPKEPGPV